MFVPRSGRRSCSRYRTSTDAQLARVPSPLVGEGQGGGLSAPSAGCFPDHMHYAFQFTKHLIIRKPKDGVALGFEPSVPPTIDLPPRLEVMTLAIELYHQPCRMADEIGDVVSNWNLPAKAQALDPMRLDVTPQQRLGTSHSLPEGLRSSTMLLAHRRMRHVSTPLPNPPPQGGREPAEYAAAPSGPLQGGWAQSMQQQTRVNLHTTASTTSFTEATMHQPPPPAVASQASPQALASSRTRRM
jgi:hypothetical protein